jgi:hypothetical protein
MVGESTKLEEYEKKLDSYDQVKKEMNRLTALGEYSNIHYVEIRRGSN